MPQNDFLTQLNARGFSPFVVLQCHINDLFDLLSCCDDSFGQQAFFKEFSAWRFPMPLFAFNNTAISYFANFMTPSPVKQTVGAAQFRRG